MVTHFIETAHMAIVEVDGEVYKVTVTDKRDDNVIKETVQKISDDRTFVTSRKYRWRQRTPTLTDYVSIIRSAIAYWRANE